MRSAAVQSINDLQRLSGQHVGQIRIHWQHLRPDLALKTP